MARWPSARRIPGGGGASIQVRVWERVGQPERNYVSARVSGGSWGTLGTIPVALDSASGAYRYGDITLRTDAGIAEVRVWEQAANPAHNYISARLQGGSWRTLGTIHLGEAPASAYQTSASGRFRYSDITLTVRPPTPSAKIHPIYTKREAANIINLHGQNHPVKNLLLCEQEQAEYHGDNWWHCSRTVFHETSGYITKLPLPLWTGLPSGEWPSPEGEWRNPFEECRAQAEDAIFVSGRSEMIHLYLKRAGHPELTHVWRCANRTVYACGYGNSPLHCSWIDRSRNPSREIIEFCTDVQDSDSLPGSAGRARYFYSWGCKDGNPIILGTEYTENNLDQWGFLRGEWTALSPSDVHYWDACYITDSARIAAEATVRVTTSNGQGTAFHVGSGRFVTAYHVVEGDHTVTLRGDGWSQGASVEYYWERNLDGTNDVAVLQAYGWPARSFAYDWASAPTLYPDDDFAVGDPIATFGFPKDAPSYAFGSITDYWPEFNDFLRHSAITAPGSSGAPIFDECAGVIGVSHSGRDSYSNGTAIANWDHIWP